MVLTDILKRFAVLSGKERPTMLTGTDEHGMKIQKAAAQAKIDVKSFCDKNYKQFEQLAKNANINYDRFIRTTDVDHMWAVEHFWSLLERRGHIYTAKHEGWYSVSDETFFPQSAVHLIQDPRTGRKLMASMETGREVEWTSEMNYHFRLSSFKEALLEFYKDNPTFIRPASRMAEVVESVASGLEDLSISRPVERLSWGIRVPGDKSQTIYVWLDALVNYITATGFPFTPGKEMQGGWPPDCQVIGKDIVRFHCVYWPAFLLALDLPPPKQTLTHAHWTMGREKMSKTTGNVVDPFWAIERFGVDTMRYYLAHDGGLRDDADYENAYIVERYKKGLSGGLGNLVSRVVRGKRWNVRRSVETAPHTYLEVVETEHISILDQLRIIVGQHFDQLDSRKALHEIMSAIYKTNVYMQIRAPWSLVSSGKSKELKILSPKEEARVDSIIYVCAESIRICGILLQPFMPTKMGLLLDMLGVHDKQRTLEYARVGADQNYGEPAVELGAGVSGTLFPPLALEEVAWNFKADLKSQDSSS